MSDRDDILLVDDIISSIQKILKYTDNMSFDDFHEDEKTIDAVVRNFEIIGEAAAKLSDEFKKDNNTIDWKKIRGFRNRLVHDYFGVDINIVWEIRNNYLPDLYNTLIKLIE